MQVPTEERGEMMATSAAAFYGDEKLVEDAAEFIKHFLETRFEGLPDDWQVLLAEVCLEMFEAGAAWADSTSGRNDIPKILTSTHN